MSSLRRLSSLLAAFVVCALLVLITHRFHYNTRLARFVRLKLGMTEDEVMGLMKDRPTETRVWRDRIDCVWALGEGQTGWITFERKDDRSPGSWDYVCGVVIRKENRALAEVQDITAFEQRSPSFLEWITGPFK